MTLVLIGDHFYTLISHGMLEPPVTYLTCKIENQTVIMKSLTPGDAGQRNSDSQVSTLEIRKDL